MRFPTLRSLPCVRRHVVRRVRAIACGTIAAIVGRGAPLAAQPSPAHAVIPAPVSISVESGRFFVFDSNTHVSHAADADTVLVRLATMTSAMLGQGGGPGVRTVTGAAEPARGAIHLAITPERRFGLEGYELRVTPERIVLRAATPAGLFYAVQTLRQLLPWSVEHAAALRRGLRVPVATVTDAPRFAWRGAMLDVARHFLPVRDVKRFVDHMALYKLNRLHLHLADDQGWRIEIAGWPELTRIGGSTQVGGGPGGYWTQAEYRELVAYAAGRFITIVPEIDMPGHTNAARASYGALNCDGKRVPLYTGTRVDLGNLCITSDSTWRFIGDVLRQLAAITPGAWLHIGGDEVRGFTRAQYHGFIERVQDTVRATGKRMIGWGEIAPAALDTTTVSQLWIKDSSAVHARRGGSVIMSFAERAYLDMKYDSSTVTGLLWAGAVSVPRSYDWDPATLRPGIGERSILGVEGPLWAETVTRLDEYEFQAFPRLIALAEVAWTPQALRSWPSFASRLGRHGPRLQALGINFFRAPEVDWAPTSGRPFRPVP